MKPILAPTDFSPASLNAVNYAADLAVATNSNLMLVHIFQFPLVYGEVPIDAITVEKQIAEAEETIKNLAEQVSVRAKGKINIDTDVYAGGAVVREIENYCKSISPSFVVMGSTGAGAMERLLFGSNTISAMKNLPCPLIVVPPGAAFKKISKIGLACDLKRVVETVPAEEITALIRQFNAELHVIHVNADDEATYPPEVIRESEMVQELLGDLHPKYRFLTSKTIDEGLNDYAEKNNLDLLIVIPKKHNLIDKLLHKSHTKHLIIHSNIPLMSVHE